MYGMSLGIDDLELTCKRLAVKRDWTTCSNYASHSKLNN